MPIISLKHTHRPGNVNCFKFTSRSSIAFFFTCEQATILHFTKMVYVSSVAREETASTVKCSREIVLLSSFCAP